MNFNVLHNFIDSGIKGFGSAWSPQDYDRFSGVIPPEMIFSGDASIKSDILFHWISWFCQSMCHIESFEKGVSKAKIFSLVRRGFANFALNFKPSEVDKLSLVIANMLYTHLNIVDGRAREKLTIRKKKEILTVKSPITAKQNSVISGSSVNKACCWICGYEFTKEALARFIGESSTPLALPEYVDVYTPRGLHERDLLIEVEHKIPFSKGGGDLDDVDNIELSCGWCNRFKSNFLSIYDCNMSPKVYFHPVLKKKISVPQPYWTIRKFAYGYQCSHPECGAKKRLLITTRNPHGAATPLNLTVTCRAHDNFSEHRLVPRHDYAERLSTRDLSFW